MYESTRKFLADNEGNGILIIGKISNLMWQHIQTSIKTHPFTNYVDLEDGYQIIVYTEDQIHCREQVEISGEVIKVVGINDPNSKAYNQLEYHIVADYWKCI